MSHDDFIDRTFSDENGWFVIHGQADDDVAKIDPYLLISNNPSSWNDIGYVIYL